MTRRDRRRRAGEHRQGVKHHASVGIHTVHTVLAEGRHSPWCHVRVTLADLGRIDGERGTDYVITAPEMMATAASDLSKIGLTIGSANASAAALTSAVLAPGADEVSAGVATMFGEYAQAYHAINAQAAAFHAQFVQHLNAGALLRQCRGRQRHSFARSARSSERPLRDGAGAAVDRQRSRRHPRNRRQRPKRWVVVGQRRRRWVRCARRQRRERWQRRVLLRQRRRRRSRWG